MRHTSTERRTAATEQFRRAEQAINNMFDRVDELRALLVAASTAATSPDPLRAATDLVHLASQVDATMAEVRAAATEAAEFTSKPELARYAETRHALLFPRTRAAGEEAPRFTTRGADVHVDTP